MTTHSPFKQRLKLVTDPNVAIVRTWNGDTTWGPMSLPDAIKFASDYHAANRYVEVAGEIVFDWVEVEGHAAEALRGRA